MSRLRFMNKHHYETLERIDELIKNAYVVTPNVDHLIQLELGGELCEAYKQADLILTDGKPLIWISEWYGTPINEKISGSNLFPKLCNLVAKNGYRVFFLEATDVVAEKVAENMTKRYQGMQVVGTYSPPCGFEKNDEEMKKIIAMVKEVQPHILIDALGCPKQELFILHHREELGVPLSLSLGASVDFEAGNIKRAPRWMANHCLEWLYRITQDPKCLAKRYLLDNMKIIRLAIKYKPSKNNRGVQHKLILMAFDSFREDGLYAA